MINVLLLEDEYKAAQETKVLLEAMSEQVSVCGILQTVEEAVDWFNKNEMPHLILSDIQLGDGLCFDIFTQVQVTAPIIFCTAYDDFALRAFENNGIDYLLKPVKKQDLEKSFNKLHQYSRLWALPEHANRFNNMLQSFKPVYKTVLSVYLGDRIMPVPVAEINYFYTNKTVVVYHHGQTFEIRTTLDRLAAQLDPELFYRANRQFIISKHDIEAVKYIDARKLEVILKSETPEKIIISKSKSAQFVKWLK
ncbi:LytTR family DNA-binding domain-containing protein [Dyadobacter sp. CY356]|uniref:LytR/AlgR family response regulator transcription factor n=1 Tax=Dyadobacter sp. CY356 TaxID=2906442 RepID=UPI001F40BE77|nr:LytTR family DNA-binding domain-containing protein [Dyadobacter sp. CY356]MCF0055083.1 LytTR family DNA-binding domain-containing protein [Dyadobacter sp. CY356]